MNINQIKYFITLVKCLNFNKAVANAKNIDMGLTGYLNIGILDGMRPTNSLIKIINQLNLFYQNLQINIMNYNFNQLMEMLYDGRLDFALTLYFDIERRTNLMYRIIEKSFDHIVVPTGHRYRCSPYQ
ncbi:hypothetical protein I6U48_26405 [Clostridium sp. PL3]|uniref:HTH lysR-type domain-containing protein n=1 Tax=Clostridium thailandense TaxID=2794346 RepID=A0A949TZA3_9CLOT|nr:substrate-binding domain-containing protein [Clostridium thailandense]MBV7276416.1 hypothetical protein [Clostridium thailandense]